MDAAPAAPAGPVIIFGASGEVGKRVLSELLSDERWAACTFHLLSRRPLPDHDALARCTVHVVDMSTAEALGGATGEVGKRVLSELLSDERWRDCTFHLLSRRPLPDHAGLARVTVHVVDMATAASLRAAADAVLKAHGPCAVAFSCVAFSRPSTKNSAGVPRGGTFHMIRFLENELPNAFAQACLDHGVRHLSAFSGQGADPNKAVLCSLPYGPGILRGMGERERDFAAMGFESVGIVRPAGILGNNNFDADALNLKFERWGLAKGKWAPIHSAGIARAMALMALRALDERAPKVRLLEGAPLFDACGPELRYADRGGEFRLGGSAGV